MKLALLAALNAARAERRLAVVVTRLADGEQRLVADPTGDPAEADIREAIRSGRSGVAGDAFIAVHRPSPRLVIVGAVHISQALAPMAAMTGYDVTVVDPRAAFASAERFPGVDLRAEWPDRADLRLDPFTAVAAVTHDPKIDDPALVAALGAKCFYVGALGSRKTHAARRQRLEGAGVPPAEIDRVRAPIGLAIGAASPAEIAVATLAEITAALRRPEEATA
ncbi:XdhC family protein [Methylopila henanensis]|uniref:XdhC family protein n=1 Tax=Methylopila henanensis TaxID=873516 RepID=A0ABW4K9W1_9HYPH